MSILNVRKPSIVYIQEGWGWKAEDKGQLGPESAPPTCILRKPLGGCTAGMGVGGNEEPGHMRSCTQFPYSVASVAPLSPLSLYTCP